MKYLLTAVLATFLVGCAEAKTSDIVADVKDGVVYITNEVSPTQGGAGTGFIVNDNQIVTNLHVVEGPGKISVYSDDSQRKYAATIVYKDPVADIAVLRLQDWELFEKNETPVNLSLGRSDAMNLGDRVIVMGHPWGLTWTVSEGIVSGKDRRPGQNPRFLFQVDANLFQGNSGGPIFNDRGQVICVSTLMLAMEGGSYGFCVPSDLVDKILYDFNAFGEIRWQVMNVTVGLTDDGSSVILNEVESGGAADKAGLKKGDKIVSIQTPHNVPNGVRVTNTNDMITELAKLNGDETTVRLLIDRNGELMMIEVKTNFRLSKDYTPDQAK